MKRIFVVISLFLLTTLVNTIVSTNQLSEQGVVQEVKNQLESGDFETAIKRMTELQKAYPDSSQAILGYVIDFAVEAFQKNEREKAINLLEEAKKMFSEESLIFSILGQFYWYEENLPMSTDNFSMAVTINPENKTAKKYLDILLFVPPNFAIPETLMTKHLYLRPLIVTDAEQDYQAVMSSIDHLKGIFGPDDDWPQSELTLEDNLQALRNHEKEHRLRTAFTYTVRDSKDEKCLGCVYIIPIHSDDYDAQIFLWVTAESFTKGYDQELYLAVKEWIGNTWPFKKVVFPGRNMDWLSYGKIQE